MNQKSQSTIRCGIGLDYFICSNTIHKNYPKFVRNDMVRFAKTCSDVIRILI